MSHKKMYKPLSVCRKFFVNLMNCQTETGVEKLLSEADYRTTNTAILLYNIGRRYRNQLYPKEFMNPDQVLSMEAIYVSLSGPEDHESDVLYLIGKDDLHDNLERALKLCGTFKYLD